MKWILQYNGEMPPLYKALLASLLFAVFGITGWIFGKHQQLPLILYYSVLVLNTFFSVRVFAAITPLNALQMLFDMVLVPVYVVLAFSFDSVFLFSIVSAGLFLIAVLKYVHLKSIVEIERQLLTRKITLNALGALLSGVAFGIALIGAEELAAWGLCIVFVLANVYLL